MPTEKQQTQVRKEQIAQAVLSLAASHGLRGLSMAAIARRVGFGATAVYRHFKNKDEVLDAALALVGSRLRANVAAVCEETDDAIDRLYRLLMRHIKLIRDNEGIPRIVFSEDFYSGQPQRRARMYRGIEAYLGKVAAIIRQGQQAGQLDRDFEPGSGALMFLGLVQPAAILWHMSDGEFDVTRQARETWQLFLKAIRRN
ncbi:MAG: Fatty acid metabolism regulator protein [Phycisphaerae bacterium]|nr:Fatty acid metabolism regulator protein [Phycisphaerae bacterium]